MPNRWALVIAVGVAGAAWGQGAAYPVKPVRLVVHIGPGSSMDIVARVLAQKLTDRWGQQVVVDNRAGAGGNIGVDLDANSSV